MNNWQKLKDYLAGLVLSALMSRHTSVSGLVVLLTSLAEILWPEYEPKCHKLREWAMSYGLIMAGDAVRKATNGTGQWKKAPDTPPVPSTPKTP